MQIIKNQSGQDVAFIRNNIIFTYNEKVIGIKIGDCCFGNSKSVIGKIINGFIYTIEGEIIGQCQQFSAPNERFASKEQLMAAWEILSNINEHACPWITITENWSDREIHEHLQGS